MANDDRKYSPLRGGIQGQVESSPSESGTLGCLAETNRQGEQKRIVFLTVAHLLYAGRSGNVIGPITQPGARACHPVACSKCSRCCSDDFGNSLRGEFSEDIDAGIATVYAGTKYLRDVEGLGFIRGTHTITEAEAHDRARPFRVRKRGIGTRVTEGVVRILDFAVHATSDNGSFDRQARNQILVQPHTLVQVPITAIQQNGVIRAAGAQFQTNGVTTKHFVEVSGPTRNRGLFQVHSVRSETEIVLANPRAPDFEAELVAEAQRPFTPVASLIFDQGGNGVDAPGLAANNPGLLPLDMAEIAGSASNDGIFQIRPLGAAAIVQDQMAVYERLTQEPAGGSQVRGSIFIRVREEAFAGKADSGAVIINDDREVVGLIAGVVGRKNRVDLQGYAFGAQIRTVTDRLGINVLAAASDGQELIVAATEGDPRPGGPVAAPLREDDRALLLRAQEELLETEAGRKCAELARLHQEEVQTLINTNRRAAVVWQRNGGPLLVQVAVNAVQHPESAIPRDLNGRPLASCMSNILQVLDEYGSPPLKSDIAKFGHAYTVLPGRSLNEVKRAFGRDPNALDAMKGSLTANDG